MKKINIMIALLFVFTLGIVGTVSADTPNNRIIYFKSATCEGCRTIEGMGTGSYVEANDYVKKIEDRGIEIIVISTDSSTPSNIPDNVIYEGDTPTTGDLLAAFGDFYNVPNDERFTPLMFVGETYYYYNDIIDAVDSGEFFTNAESDFLEVNVTAGQNWQSLKSFVGFLGVLGAGFLDGFNPCAIALLLLFISLLGFTENKKTLILVSTTYIFTLFLSYFLIGVGLIRLINKYVHEIEIISLIVSWVIFIVVIILFIVNFYDYLVSKNEDYGKIKNQLPKWIQKMNKRIMKTFTGVMNTEGSKGNTIRVVLLTFLLGLTMSITEFICTGQIYLGILEGVSYFQDTYAYIALISYNIMFVSPMIIIAVVSVRNGSIMSSSNWIREHMHIIKLLNSLLFLGIAIFYAFRIFG